MNPIRGKCNQCFRPISIVASVIFVLNFAPKICADDPGISLVRALNGNVYFNSENRTKVDALYFTVGDLTDAQAASVLAYFPDLKRLAINSNQMTDGVISSVRPLKGLTTIYLDGQRLTRLSFDRENFPSLKEIFISGPRLTAETVANLARLDGVDYLSLSELTLGDQDLAPLAQSRTKGLCLYKCSRITDQIANTLSQMTHLEHLGINDLNVGRETLKCVSKLKQLEVLSLKSVRIGNESLAHLSECPKLHYVSLWNIPLNASQVKDLETIRKLKTLHIDENIVDKVALQALKAAKPDLKIESSKVLVPPQTK